MTDAQREIISLLQQIKDASGGGGGAVNWGEILGTLSNQTDLQTELDAKGPVPDNSVYGVGWNGSTAAPTQDKVYDKIEAVVASIPAAADISSGVYTPTATPITNIDGSDVSECQWLRVSSVVTVSGKIRIEATATGVTQLDIDLPLGTSATFDGSLAGTGCSIDTSVAQVAAIYQNGTGGARIEFLAVGTDNKFMFFTFTYKTSPD